MYNAQQVFIEREESSEQRVHEAFENDEIDSKYGFERVKDTIERTGFLINMHSNEILDTNKRLISVVDYYFLENNGNRFKVSMPFQPYFYILVPKDKIQETSQFLMNKFSGYLNSIDIVFKEDLDLPNHLTGLKQKYLKMSFLNVTNMIRVRKDILKNVRKNTSKNDSAYYDLLKTHLGNVAGDKSDNVDTNKMTNHFENILDIREYDVPYHVRVSIDKQIFCGLWYNVKAHSLAEEQPQFTKRSDIIDRPDLIILAYDIETTKLPLKFPDSSIDQIMMISYMINGEGFLINNRQIIGQDVESFNYTPKPEFKGHFTVFNEPDEKAVLIKFFDHILLVRPNIFVTYNGDFFDWPFVETRAAIYEMDMKKEIGFSKSNDGIYCSRAAMHMVSRVNFAPRLKTQT